MSANPLSYLGSGPASENDPGIVELATAAETIAGISRTLACTPFGVAGLISFGAPAASTTVAGILKTATNGDAAAQLLSNIAIVPSNLPFIMAEPGDIGGTTPAAGTFTTLTFDTIVLTNPLDVSEGGTGLTTITNHGVMLGSGTGAVTATSAGTVEQVFISQGAGADPVFSDDLDLIGTLDVTGVATFDSTSTFVGTATMAAITASGLITGTAGATINGAAINLGSTATTDAVNIGTGAAAKTITVGNSTSTTNISLNTGTGSSLNLGTNAIAHTITIGNGTGATAVTINSGTNGVNVGTNAVAQTVTIGNVTGTSAIVLNSGTGGVAINTTTTGDVVVTSADTVLIDGAGVIEINSSAGVIGIGNDAVAQNINVGTGAAARTITVGNVTGATAVVLNSGTGGVAVNSTGAGDIIVTSADTVLVDAAGVLELNSSAGVIGIGNDAVAQNINIGTGAAARVITIGNVSSTTGIVLNSGTGHIALNTTTTGDVIVTSADTVLIDGAGVVELNSSGAAINIGNDAVAQAINIGTGAAARTLTIGNVTGATAVVINAGSGATTINTSLKLATAATQLQVEGGAATDFIGTGTLVLGTATVANTNIAATDRIYLQRTALNASPALGFLAYTINAATSFVVTSYDATGSPEAADISSFTYFIVRQL